MEEPPRRPPWRALSALVGPGLLALLGCRGAGTSAPSTEEIAARTSASRVVVARSEPGGDGWHLIYRSQVDVPLRCRANLRWREDHPPRDPVADVAQEFMVPARAEVEVVFPRPERPAGATDYAVIEAEEDGLYLSCETGSGG